MERGNQRLHHYIENVLLFGGENIYIKTQTDSFSYNQVYEMALSFRKVLMEAGIKDKERVVIYSSKNVASVAMMIACSLCSCIYVPVSRSNPAERAKFIIKETNARFVLCDNETKYELHKASLIPDCIYNGYGVNIFSIPIDKNEITVRENAAFILFTSGSTGVPKGVVISHSAAITFIDWAANEFKITDKDVIASIAPFNFDLSVFDIYVTAKKAATLKLYTESETKNALLMAQLLSIDKVSKIYATPSFFSSLAFYGKMQNYTYDALDTVLFAGEVFHLETFKTLLTYWPDKIYANLYGPTETNVCTFFRVNTNQMNYPFFPIGKPCSYAQVIIVDEYGIEITKKNIQGELLITGDSIFLEYWNDPENTSTSFFKHQNQTPYYKTGDMVFINNEDELVYVSRKDRMIKKNGFRIEPLEIERIISGYPKVTKTAVLFAKDKNQLICFVEFPEFFDDYFNKLKLFCQNYLPAYMIPDKFVILESMPTTSSGKIDLQVLENQL